MKTTSSHRSNLKPTSRNRPTSTNPHRWWSRRLTSLLASMAAMIEWRRSRAASRIFARSEESRLDDMADPDALEGLEDDPRALGKMMRKMSREMGGEMDAEMGPEINEMIDRYKVDGIYIDCWGPSSCEAGACGWVDSDGKRRGTPPRKTPRAKA